MEVIYNVNVVMDNNIIGDGVIKLIDEYSDGTEQKVITRTVSGNVVIDGFSIGTASGTYDDYVSYGSGGSRTISIPIYTYMDTTQLAVASLTHTDRYGAVVTQPPPEEPSPPPPPPEQPPPEEVELKPQPYPKLLWLLPLGLLFIILIGRRKEKEEKE